MLCGGSIVKIKTIQISGYRKIREAKINMEDSITVIAGANNSGKTSIVELFNFVFNSKGKLCCDDFPVFECQRWCNAVFPHVQTQFASGNTKEDIIANIIETVVASKKTDTAILISPIEVKIQVDYDPTNDDIRNFADYIMELDPTNYCFYFIYRFELDVDLLRKSLDSEYEKLYSRFRKLSGDNEKDSEGIRIIKEMLLLLYANSCKENTYFSDKTYCNMIPMEQTSFKALFNYQNIMAGRTLDDESSDRAKILSKNMIDIASQEDDWKELIQSLPDKIKQPIEDAQIQREVRKASVETLGRAIEQISRTNGGQVGHITIDMMVTEEAVQSLLKSITSAKYQVDDVYLRESSQGLGYSNLIFIHLQLEQYRKTIDPLLVNFFVIEEPEAHMHPQMQNVFSQYLFDYYNKEHTIQGFITTHSHEVVRNVHISQLRVLRQTDPFSCRLFDLHEFVEVIRSKEELKNLIDFYDWFYTINFPDIIFADKVILYEGDTERMLIKNALISDEFESLKSQYISYVQVGGAYAINYRPILNYLKIKSLIITDLDYDKEALSEEDIMKSCSTNATINAFAKDVLRKDSPTVEELYSWQTEASPIVIDDCICLAFQGKADHFARTLEEAMLTKLYSLSAVELKTREEWLSLRKKDQLQFVIPRNKTDCSTRTIIQHTADNKTDFMYSVILNNLVRSMLPTYIEEGLMWLAK